MLGRCEACKFDAPAGVHPASAEYHRLHREHHLRKFPRAPETTRDALDELVRMAERGAMLPRSRAQ